MLRYRRTKFFGDKNSTSEPKKRFLAQNREEIFTTN